MKFIDYRLKKNVYFDLNRFFFLSKLEFKEEEKKSVSKIFFPT